MKNLKNLGQALTKAEQKTINGGGDPIAGFPGSGNGNGGGGNSSGTRCFCLSQKWNNIPIYVGCNTKCSDGTDPLEY